MSAQEAGEEAGMSVLRKAVRLHRRLGEHCHDVRYAVKNGSVSDYSRLQTIWRRVREDE